MFKDYYAILGVSHDASPIELKQAFKSQALEWHPDRNADPSATSMMQDINEAYLILSDPDARSRYDEEYDKYRLYQQADSTGTPSVEKEESWKKTQRPSQYDFDDEVLRRWVENARSQARGIVEQLLQDTKGMARSGAKYSAQVFAYQAVGIVLLFATMGLIRACGQ